MLVMKFKGAVLQNQETLAEVKNRIKEQNCCSIVVVSALKGVMPRLRQLYGLSLRRGTGFENEFNELKQVHEQLAYELLAGRKLDEYKVELQKELDDLYGILCISGNNNSVIANHISEIIHTQSIKPAGAKPVIIHIVSGKGNYISDNHIVATTEVADEQTKASDSCFSAQVDALTTTDKLVALDVTAVLVEKESVQNTILDSGSEGQVIIDRTVNAFRATPVPGV